MVSFDGRAYSQEWGSESGEIHGANVLSRGREPTAGIQQTDAIPRNQAAKRVSDYANLCDVLSQRCKSGEFILNLSSNALAANVDAVVGEILAIAFGDECVEGLLGVFGSQGFLEGSEVLGTTPKSRENAISRGSTMVVVSDRYP